MSAAVAEPGMAARHGRDRLDQARLGRWLAANLEGFSPPFSVTRFAGGQSNPTYRIDARSGRYVLRRKPSGPLLDSAHAIEREYRVIAALSLTDVPVPRPYCLCADDTVVGSPFYVMELIEGQSFWNGALPELDPAQRTALYDAMVDTLADLHAVDYEAVGLGAYGRPGNFYERQVRRWTRQYRDAQTDDIPEIERLIAWLPRTAPEPSRLCIVHGDYRIDNLIFSSGYPRVRAVLDWELSTIGDPIADLTYLLTNWIEGRDAPSSVAALNLVESGIPSLDRMAERYRARSGCPRLPGFDWYFSFNFFRLACIVQGIKKRVIDGTAAGAHAAAVAQRTAQLAACAWDRAIRAGA